MATSARIGGSTSTRIVTFQVISDLHFDKDPVKVQGYKEYAKSITSRAKYLIIPGDIGNIDNLGYTEFLKDLYMKNSPGWEKIIIVPGNSEYNAAGTKTISQTLGILHTFKNLDPRQDPNRRPGETLTQKDRLVVCSNRVQFLENRSVIVIGATLWSKIRRDHIYIDDGSLEGETKEAHNRRSARDFDFIRAKVRDARREFPSAKVLIVTHHAPAVQGTGQPERDGRGSSWSNFQSDILGGVGIEGLRDGDVWVFGHTHFSCDFKQDQVRVIANQRGGFQNDNPVGRTKTRWNPDFTFNMGIENASISVIRGYPRNVFPFEMLPVELRLKLYLYLVPIQVSATDVQIRAEDIATYTEHVPPFLRAVLGNKTLLNEAISVYREHNFIVHYDQQDAFRKKPFRELLKITGIKLVFGIRNSQTAGHYYFFRGDKCLLKNNFETIIFDLSRVPFDKDVDTGYWMLAIWLINTSAKVRTFIAKIPVVFDSSAEPYTVTDMNAKLGVVGRRDTDAETNGVEVWVWEAEFPRSLEADARNRAQVSRSRSGF